MGELWRDLVELLGRRPLLWAPVLLADMLGFFLTLGRDSVLRLVILHATSQRSALGGGVLHGPMSASALQSTTVVALLLTWFTYLLRTLLYAAALVSTAALISGYRRRLPKPVSAIPPQLRTQWGTILELALRTLAVYALAALLVGWLAPALSRHGHTSLVHSPWFGYAMALLLSLVLSLLLPPVVLRLLAGRNPPQELVQLSRLFAVILAVVDSLLATAVNANSRELAQVAVGARLPLELVASLVVALPYVLLFTGLTLLANRAVAMAEDDTRV